MEQQTWTPERILQTTGAYWATCALQGAVALDVFGLIGDGQRDGAGVARELDAPADGVERLLDALAAMGLLVKSTDGYANTEASRTYLCNDSERYLGYIIQHHHHLVASWARLPEAVRTGKPIRKLVRAEDAREAFLMGMFNLAMQLAPRLVPAVDLAGRRSLLDLGGGPGTYAIHFCKQYPELAATVVDLATTRPFAETTIRRLGMAQRVSFVAGDYLKDDIPGGFDAVWMSHILHAESEDACRLVVDKAFGCLNPGGLAVIHEFILNDSLDGPLFPALFSLNMLLGTDGGRAYSQAQLSGMLLAAGFTDVRRLEFTGPNDSGLMMGVKPA
jgi:SAM-dependent methyltransferase